MSDIIERKKLINWVKNLAQNHFQLVPKIIFNGRTHKLAFLSDICQFIGDKFKYKIDPVEFLRLTDGQPLALSIQRIKEPEQLAGFSILYNEKSPENISLSRLIALSVVDDFNNKKPFRARSSSSSSKSIKSHNLFELADSETTSELHSSEDVIIQQSLSLNQPPSDSAAIRNTAGDAKIFTRPDQSRTNDFILSGSEEELSNSKPESSKPTSFKTTNALPSVPLKRKAIELSDSEDEIFKEFSTLSISKKSKSHHDFDQSAIKVDVNELSNKFKSPFTSNTTIVNNTIEDKIDYSFGNNPVLSMDTFQTSYCSVNGTMFNYKVEKCSNTSHNHPSLSKFLKCFPSVLEPKQFKKMYLINKTTRMAEINKKRIQRYTKKTNNKKHYRACIEALVTTLFACKTTLNLDDFLNTFNYVYKHSFAQCCNNAKPAEYLSNLQSSNIVLVKKDGEYNLTVTPFNSSTYKDYGTVESRRVIEEFEKTLLESRSSTIQKKNTKGTAHILLSFSNPDICQALDDLLQIADLNIPKSVQIPLESDLKDHVDISLTTYLTSAVNFTFK